MKRGLSLVLIVIFLFVLVACGKTNVETTEENVSEKTKTETTEENVSSKAENEEDTSNKEKRSIGTDAVGNEFNIPDNLTRIGITPIPWASVLYSIDNSSDRIVAINPSAMKAYENSLLEIMDPNFENIDDEIIGKDFKFNDEEVLKADIQAMLIWDHQEDERERLLKMGISPIMVKNETVEDLQASLKAVGQLLGKEEKADKFIQLYNDSYNLMKSYESSVNSVEKKKVLYLKDSGLKIQGSNNFIREALELAGADNIVGDGKTITMEEIIVQDPEIILLSNFDKISPDDIYNNKIEGQDWSNVNAVKNKRVYKMPLGINRWDAPGVETPLMMLYLGKIIQPEVFEDVNFRQNFVDFYKEFFDYDISESDMAKVLKFDQNKESLDIIID